MKSVIQSDNSRCYLCGRNGNGDPLEEHHIFFGAANRTLSEEDGMKVMLCGTRCHRNGKEAAHRNRQTDLLLKQKAQTVWEARNGKRENFIRRYGRNYL